LQELITKISQTYINVLPDQLDIAINNSLAELGNFIGVDRFYIFGYNFEKQTCSNTYEWCSQNTKPLKEFLQNYPIGTVPEWTELHCKGEIVSIPDVSALHPESGMYKILKTKGIKSIITVPIMDNNRCVGFLGMDSVIKSHNYSDLEKRLLTIFSKMLVNVKNHVKTIDALNENQRFLSDIIENSGSMIFVKDTEGKYLKVNRKWESIMGLTQEKVIGKTDSVLFSQEVAGQLKRNDQSVIQFGESIEVEEILLTPQGPRYFLTIKFPLKDHQGTITGLCCKCTEITERKKAEIELQKALMHSKAVLDANPDLMFILDSECRFVNYQKKESDSYYRPPELFLGKKIEEVLPFDIAGLIRDRVASVLKTGKPSYATYELTFHNERRYFEARFILYGDCEILSIVRDITDLEDARNALQESEVRYRSILDVAPVGIIVHQNFQLVYVNPKALTLLGIENESQLFGKTIGDFIHPDYLEENFQGIQRMIDGEPVNFPVEIQLVRVDGTVLDVELTASVLNYNRKPAIQAIIHDITERKRHLNALKEQNKVLKKIAWTQSHLVRSPLSRMMGLIMLLEEGDFTFLNELDLFQSKEDVLDEIKHSAQELDLIIRDVSQQINSVKFIDD
jgi:PAS domain S-box-containing protein